MSVLIKFPIEVFAQLVGKKIDLGDEGVGQGSPDTLKAILMGSGFVFNEVNHTFANSGIVRLATPTISSLVEQSGTLGAGTYYYRVTAINSVGETLASTEDSVVIAASKGVQITWGAIDGATGYRIFGRTQATEQLLIAVGAVTTWTDTGALTPAGALPSSNTTGEELITGGGYTANTKVVGALILQKDLINKLYEIIVPPVTWTPSGTIGPAAGLCVIDSTPASLADQPIVYYVDFGGDKSESNPTNFVVPSQRVKLKGILGS